LGNLNPSQYRCTQHNTYHFIKQQECVHNRCHLSVTSILSLPSDMATHRCHTQSFRQRRGIQLLDELDHEKVLRTDKGQCVLPGVCSDTSFKTIDTILTLKLQSNKQTTAKLLIWMSLMS